MKVKDYEKFVRESAFEGLADDAYNVVGLCGESGEVAEWVKKMVLRKTKRGDLTEEDLKLELGDVLHYLTRLAINHGWTLKDCMVANQAKIEARLR